jgi:hypothetical protein
MFPSFSNLNSLGLNLRSILIVIHKHMEEFFCMFNDCYPPEHNIRLGNMWIINPSVDHSNSHIDTEIEKLAKLSSDLVMQSTLMVEADSLQIADEIKCHFHKDYCLRKLL